MNGASEHEIAGPPAVSPRLEPPDPAYTPLTVLSPRITPAVANQPTTDPGFTLNAEEALIGTCLAYTDGPYQVLDILLPDHFLDARLGTCWKLIMDMIRESLRVDAYSFRTYVVQAGMSDFVPDQARLVTLSIEALYHEHVRSYALQIIEGYASRNLLGFTQEARQIACRSGSARQRFAEIAEALNQAEQVSFSAIRSGPKPIGDAVETLHDQIRTAHDRGGVIGLSTSFRRLDHVLGGIGRDDLLILAARPAMGKSTLLLNIADYVATVIGTVLIFSGEMSAEQMLAKVISQRASIDTLRMRRGDLSEYEWDRWTETAGRFKLNKNLIVDDRGRPTLNQILATARAVNARTPLSLIAVDHLQLVNAEGFERDRVGGLGLISGSLKGLAKNLGVPVVALSQLNRGVELRDNKRPRLADLRESGALEQDADTVVFIYRDDYYNPGTSPDPGVAEIIIEKSRHGTPGVVKLKFEGEFSRFTELPDDYVSTSGRTAALPIIREF